MKIFVWLFMVVLLFASLACWLLSSLLVRPLLSGFKTESLPAITLQVLYPDTWILFLPLPWLIYAAVLSRRRELTRGDALIFASTTVAATVVLVCAIVTACLLPMWPRPISMLPNKSRGCVKTLASKFGNDQILVVSHFGEMRRRIEWSEIEFSHSLSLQATRDGVFSSAARFTSFGPACLSSSR
jgi:hypothetical protein